MMFFGGLCLARDGGAIDVSVGTLAKTGSAVLFVALLGFAVLGAILFYEHALDDDRRQMLRQVRREASDTADLAGDYISALQKQSEAVQESPFFAAAVEEFVEGDGIDPRLEESLQRRIRSEQAACDLASISLFDLNGRMVLSTGRRVQKASCIEAISRQAVGGGAIRIVNCSGECASDSCLIIPLHEGGDPEARVVAVLQEKFNLSRGVTRARRQRESPQVRTYLVRTDSADELGLSVDGHTSEQGAPDAFEQRPVALPSLSPDTVSVEEAIVDTPWKVVVTGDTSQMARTTKRQTALLALVSAVAFCAAGVAIRPIWKQQSDEYRRLLELSRNDRDLFATQLDMLSKNANDVILLFDEQFRVVLFNDRALRAYRLDPESLRFARLRQIVDNDAIGPCMKRLSELGDEGALFESIHVRSDGSTFPVECSVRSIQAGDTSHYQFIIRDITSRKGSEVEIRLHQARLRALASELVLAEERERRTLATSLHDTIGQNLALVSMRLRMRETGADAEWLLDETLLAVESCLEETRSLTCELSPPVLYELGLLPAIDWLAEEFAHRHGVKCSIVSDGRPMPLGRDVSSALFSSVRELLTNVVKHAEANEVTITVTRHSEEVAIIVTDDGVGFDADLVADSSWNGSSFGLFSVRERFDYLGGLMLIVSAPGEGTSITLVAPLSTDREITDGSCDDDSSCAG
jgi:PAS domain S-box-containing protein